MHGSAKDDSVIVWFCIDWSARCSEEKRASTYLWVKLKLDDRADFCFDVLGKEFEGTGVVTNRDDLNHPLVHVVCA